MNKILKIGLVIVPVFVLSSCAKTSPLKNEGRSAADPSAVITENLSVTPMPSIYSSGDADEQLLKSLELDDSVNIDAQFRELENEIQ